VILASLGPYIFAFGAIAFFVFFALLPPIVEGLEKSKTVERAAEAMSAGDEVDPNIRNFLIGFVSAAIIAVFLFLMLR
jgi:hypothetical protein